MAICNKTELVCKECGESICGIDGIQDLEEDPPIFMINPYYGVLKQVSYLPYKNNYTDYVLENYRVSSWEVCNKNHIIAWNEDGYTFVCEASPIMFRLPMLKYYSLEKKYWANNFYQINALSEKWKKEYENLKFSLNCTICELDFKNIQEFYAHINKENHKLKETLFLGPYISC